MSANELSGYGKLLTQDTWEGYCDDLQMPSHCSYYLEAHAQFIIAIDEILASAKNPDEVKEKLTTLRNERHAFLIYAENNLPR